MKKLIFLIISLVFLVGCSSPNINSGNLDALDTNEDYNGQVSDEASNTDNSINKSNDYEPANVIGTEEPQKTIKTITPVVPSSPSYTCSCSKTCAQMSSCAEAQYQLNVCGCSRRDGDGDGIACDSDCQ